ncbi:MAG: hypothetical protein J6A89_07125 [Clostridia bacterium]|nr:hypothetical protein [Bacilli bacterium]MBO5349569.1 hypothetical protein [Clostridia bacterium]
MTDNTNVESKKCKKNYMPQKLKDRAYNYDQTLFKVFGEGKDKKIKLVRMNYLKTSGIELDDIEYVRGTVNENKINESILRSKSKIFELAFCNPWDWFFTGTINPNKQDRTDLELFHKQLTQWLRDYNKKYKLNIKFLFVPEKHKDGKSWHIHGFIYGLPVEHLIQFQVGDKMGKGLADKVMQGDIVYNWQAYFNRFGFCDLEPIRNHEAVSKYVTKYINKELANSVTELNAHTYYHSRGLKFAELIKKGTMIWEDIAPTYKNDYCSVCWLDYTEELFDKLSNQFI